MASAFKRGKVWYAKYKNEQGKAVRIATHAQTKTEAKRLAHDLEQQAEKKRLHLDPNAADRVDETFAECAAWWLEAYSKGSASYKTETSAVRVHLANRTFRQPKNGDGIEGQIEKFLHSKKGAYEPQTINHLRGYICRIFDKAIKQRRFAGPNVAIRTAGGEHSTNFKQDPMSEKLNGLGREANPVKTDWTIGRHGDLLTRKEAAAYLGRSVSAHAHGWGPRPLANYKRPIMYSRAACDAILQRCREDQETCSTNANTQKIGGVNSPSPDKPSAAQREQQIAARLKSQLAACEGSIRP